MIQQCSTHGLALVVPHEMAWLGLQRRTRRAPADRYTTHLEEANAQENADLTTELDTTGGILL